MKTIDKTIKLYILVETNTVNTDISVSKFATEAEATAAMVKNYWEKGERVTKNADNFLAFHDDTHYRINIEDTNETYYGCIKTVELEVAIDVT